MSGLVLNTDQRAEARKIVLQGARKGLAHAPEIHYSQNAVLRWEAITHGLRVVKGQFPHHADCSSYATWLLMNAATHAKRDLTIEDFLNGEHFKGGFTGTLKDHGVRIGTHGTADHVLPMDLAHYGGGSGKHVAVCIGDGMVFSHGSEGGPYKLPIHYRGDLAEIRRYILAPR